MYGSTRRCFMKFEELEKQCGKKLTLRQKAFLESDAATLAKNQLTLMVNDPVYNTRVAYQSSPASTATTFVGWHMLYLSLHPKLSPQHYLANLRLKLKVRG